MATGNATPRRRRSTAGPWLLTESPLGWADRSRVADLLREADQRVTETEQQLAEAEYRAAVSRYERDRLRARRSIRLVTALADSASPRGVLALPRRVQRALAPTKGPRQPTPPPPPAERFETRRAGRELAPELRAPRRPGAGRYRHLRVLHLGALARFNSLVEHVPVDPDRWRAQVTEPFDLLLLEPPAGQVAWDPLADVVPALLDAARAAGLTSVRIVEPPQDGAALAAPPGRATLELVETAQDVVHAADGPLRPTVDTSVCNPVGLQLTAPDPVVALLGAEPDEVGRAAMAAFDPAVVLLHPPDIPRVPGHDARRGLGSLEAVQRAFVRAGVLLDHPGWRGGPTATERTWATALACGTPVVTVEPDSATLPPGVVATTAAQMVDTVHELTVDLDRRERLGIVGRRWVWEGRTREHALREILDHLDIPAPPPLTTTVLLATNRPERVSSALAAVERQTRAGVDIVLALHGDGFDTPPDSDLVSAVLRVPAERCLGDVLNAALDAATGDLVAKMDDDDHYGPEHLRDLVNAWSYSGADLVGKKIEYVHLRERGCTIRRPPSRPERDRPHVGGPTLLGARDLLRHYRFLRLPNRVDSTLYERLLADGRRIYGTHSRDVILERTAGTHAWSVEDQSFLDEAVEQRDGLAIDLATSDPAAGT